MELHYALCMSYPVLYLILGGLFVIGVLLVIGVLMIVLRNNSGQTTHNIHDEALWSGHSDDVRDRAHGSPSATDHDLSNGDGGDASSDSGSSSSD